MRPGRRRVGSEAHSYRDARDVVVEAVADVGKAQAADEVQERQRRERAFEVDRAPVAHRLRGGVAVAVEGDGRDPAVERDGEDAVRLDADAEVERERRDGVGGRDGEEVLAAATTASR
jgi:hypothetical protein